MRSLELGLFSDESLSGSFDDFEFLMFFSAAVSLDFFSRTKKVEIHVMCIMEFQNNVKLRMKTFEISALQMYIVPTLIRMIKSKDMILS